MVILLTFVKPENPWATYSIQALALVLSYIAWAKEDNPWMKIDETIMEELISSMVLIYDDGHGFKIFKDGLGFIAFKEDKQGFYTKSLT